MPIAHAELFRQLTDLMPLGIYVIDHAKSIIFWNQVASQITGYQAQEVVGRRCSEALLSHCSVQGEPLCRKGGCLMSQTLKDGNPRRMAVLLQHKEGHRIRIIAQTVPVRNEEGKIFAVGQIFQLESFVAGLLSDNPDLTPRSHAELSSPEASEEQLRLHWLHEREQLSAFLISIDNLHELEVKRSPALAQTVLRTVAKTFSNALWMPHFLGMWTNQRFLLLVPRCNRSCQEEVIRELRAVAGTCVITWWGDRVVPNIQICAAAAATHSSPESLLSSLDPEWSSLNRQ